MPPMCQATYCVAVSAQMATNSSSSSGRTCHTSLSRQRVYSFPWLWAVSIGSDTPDTLPSQGGALKKRGSLCSGFFGEVSCQVQKLRLDQESANDSPQASYSPLPVFRNKVLLEHGPYLLIYKLSMATFFLQWQCWIIARVYMTRKYLICTEKIKTSRLYH
jgi:hypothetical protein